MATPLSPRGPLHAVTAAVRERTVSVTEVVTASVERVRDATDTLNVASDLDLAGALAEAGAVDRGERPFGPLSGAPLLVKDLEDWAGHPTRQGSLTTSPEPATTTATVPRRLMEAGAIAIGKATLPEFAIEGFTANPLTGVTRNPWNPELSPGGSSGGSAAALSAGLVSIATATDGGGSVRIPASLCGLVGLKPTSGVIGQWPTPDWIDYSTDGPLAVSADDLRLLFSLMRGGVAGDPRLDTEATWDEPWRPRRLVAAERTSDLGPLANDVRDQLHAAVTRFAEVVGAEVTWMAPSDFFLDGDPDLDWFTIATAEHVASLGRATIERDFERYHPATQAFFEVGLKVSIDEYLAARRRRFTYVRRLDQLLGADGVLLTPTVASSGFLADGRLGPDAPLAGLPPEVYSTAMQNVTGHPALSLPAGHLTTGLPFGLQVTAPRGYDLGLLDLADQWQAAYPWPRYAPGYQGLEQYFNLV